WCCLIGIWPPSTQAAVEHGQLARSQREVSGNRTGVGGGVTATHGGGVILDSRACFGDEVAERRERDELAVGEEIGKGPHAVVGRLEVARVTGQVRFGHAVRTSDVGGLDVLIGGRKVYALAL